LQISVGDICGTITGEASYLFVAAPPVETRVEGLAFFGVELTMTTIET
jgi:hypothetical protein